MREAYMPVECPLVCCNTAPAFGILSLVNASCGVVYLLLHRSCHVSQK